MTSRETLAVERAPDDDPEARLVRAIAEVARVTLERPRVGVRHDDADDVDGSVATDDAIGFDPRPILRALHEHGARVVVMGQVAGILHGSKELTGDLDLLWDGSSARAVEMADAFASVAAEIFDADAQVVPCSPASFRLPKVLFRTSSASGDCCTPMLPWGDTDVRSIIDRAALARCRDGTEIWYVDAEDLIAMRRAVGRPKDRRRADELARILSTG